MPCPNCGSTTLMHNSWCNIHNTIENYTHYEEPYVHRHMDINHLCRKLISLLKAHNKKLLKLKNENWKILLNTYNSEDENILIHFRTFCWQKNVEPTLLNDTSNNPELEKFLIKFEGMWK